MNLIISFSARQKGNCDSIATYIGKTQDCVIAFRNLNFHPCISCAYECMATQCKYREDDLYALFTSMKRYEKIILIVPMYCGNPSSLYYIFNERSQDYFMHNDDYPEIIQKLYFIGVYGDKISSPDYLACFEKWFEGLNNEGHVLGLERHNYDQKIEDKLLDIEEVKGRIDRFVNK